MRWGISLCGLCFFALTSAFHDEVGTAPGDLAAEHRSTPDVMLDVEENQSNQRTDNRGFLSPRMDYDQWKPIGRGDPLQNDPTYDYVPPVLDKVHYWIDPASRKVDEPQRSEKRKSEVLVLGVSSKKPSAINSNMRKDNIDNTHKYVGAQKMHHHNMYNQHVRPNMPHRAQQNSANAIFPSYYKNKYEGVPYKGGDQSIPLTILVPPPPPPPRTDSMYFVQQMPSFDSSTPAPAYSNIIPMEQSPNLSYNEANLIFQSSSANGQEYWTDINNGIHKDENIMNQPGAWHSTTASPQPALMEINNTESNLYNIIQFENNEEITKSTPSPISGSYSVEIVPSDPYSPEEPSKTFVPSLFLYNSSNDIPSIQTTTLANINIEIADNTTNLTNTEQISLNFMEVAPPNKNYSYSFTEPPTAFLPTESYFEKPHKPQPSKNSVYDMMRPMQDIPITAPANINNQTFNIFKPVLPTIPPAHTFNLQNNRSPLFSNQDELIESMQTIQPPPVTRTERIPTIIPQHPNYIHASLHKESYFAPQNFVTSPVISTTPTTTTPAVNSLTTDPIFKHYKQPKEPVTGPMYLIIQGHSKVKTYSGAKKKITQAKELPDINEVDEGKEKEQYVVKHLHTRKENIKEDLNDNFDRTGRNLKHLINDGVGRIEVQEADLGIKYDVSDGSDVPVEIYHKGIVENEDLVYENHHQGNTSVRAKRDIIESIEETVESFLYDYLKKKSEEKGLSGILASAVTSDAAEVIDDLEYEN